MSKFWKRVEKCKHEHLSPNYYELFGCIVCHNGRESHCLDCGVFIEECACGCNNGFSGWSRARHKAYDRKHGSA